MRREQTTIRLPEELKTQLQREADRRGDSFNETLIRLIRLGLQLQSDREHVHSPQPPVGVKIPARGVQPDGDRG